MAKPGSFKMKLGTSNWKVRLTRKAPRLDGEELDGYCNHSTRTIGLDATLYDDEIIRVFCHELLHAIDNDKKEEWVDVVGEQLGNAIIALFDYLEGESHVQKKS